MEEKIGALRAEKAQDVVYMKHIFSCLKLSVLCSVNFIFHVIFGGLSGLSMSDLLYERKHITKPGERQGTIKHLPIRNANHSSLPLKVSTKERLDGPFKMTKH